MVQELLKANIDLHCLRDCTRGGVATTLVEIADVAQLSVEINEAAIPVNEAVRGACEILGLDPLYVANEGRFIAFVPPAQADRTVTILRAHPAGSESVVIGKVASKPPGQVSLKSIIGAQRIVHMLAGEQLPRIC
jgi:hydrogenase expression/formation protein HypE